MAGQASKQASRQVSSQRQRQQQRAARTTTLATEPKRRSLKIWVGMQAEMERAGVVGGWATACSTNPLGCVGYRQSAWAGVVVVGRVVSVHGYLTCVLIVSDAHCKRRAGAASGGPHTSMRLSHGRAWTAEREGVAERRVYAAVEAHARAARPSCVAHAHEHMIDGALQEEQPAPASTDTTLSQQVAVP